MPWRSIDHWANSDAALRLLFGLRLATSSENKSEPGAHYRQDSNGGRF